jgi:hypothetical protein
MRYFRLYMIKLGGGGVFAVALRYCATSRKVAGSIPVAERYKTRVCGLSLAGVPGSNPSGGMYVNVVCCK